MTATDWNTTAATWGEASLSLHGLLGQLHRSRRLQPLLRQAIIEQFLLREASPEFGWRFLRNLPSGNKLTAFRFLICSQ